MKTVLLSFDTEEFDVPKEHGVDFSLDEGINVSVEGTNRILDVLKETGVVATFFCTGNFIRKAPDIIKRLLNEGHELACHGVDHWKPQETDFKESKKIAEEFLQSAAIRRQDKVYGYRQPRMFAVSDNEIAGAGYMYNSSLNPAFIPGRYMHLTTPRVCFMKERVLQIPASVTPLFRIPLFWLALHNFPESFYYFLVKRTMNHDGHFVTYFHPWEFVELKQHPEWKMPFIIKNHSGKQMAERLRRLILKLKADGCEFSDYRTFAEKKILELQ